MILPGRGTGAFNLTAVRSTTAAAGGVASACWASAWAGWPASRNASMLSGMRESARLRSTICWSLLAGSRAPRRAWPLTRKVTSLMFNVSLGSKRHLQLVRHFLNGLPRLIGQGNPVDPALAARTHLGLAGQQDLTETFDGGSALEAFTLFVGLDGKLLQRHEARDVQRHQDGPIAALKLGRHRRPEAREPAGHQLDHNAQAVALVRAEGQQRPAVVEVSRLNRRLPVAINNQTGRHLLALVPCQPQLALRHDRGGEIHHQRVLPGAAWNAPSHGVGAHAGPAPAKGGH